MTIATASSSNNSSTLRLVRGRKEVTMLMDWRSRRCRRRHLRLLQSMSIVTSSRLRTRRNVELLLLLLAVAIVMVAYLNVGLAIDGTFPPDLVKYGSGLLALSVGFHLVLRWRASYAD